MAIDLGHTVDIKDLESSCVDGNIVTGTIEGKRIVGNLISDDRVKIMGIAETIALDGAQKNI